MNFNFGTGTNFTLGGLMGASPYSNMPVMTVRHPTPRNTPGGGGGGGGIINFSPLQSAFQPHQKSTPLLLLQHDKPTPPVIKYKIPDDVIQDVLCRFIMNIPEEEKHDPVRALFQVELAHWFFIDHYCSTSSDNPHPSLASLSHIPFSQFAYIIFKAAPHLRKHFNNVDKYLQDFRSYRMKVPTYGAILMNQELTKVLLVQGMRGQWGFPKGKVNETEDPEECAIREVFEETGYDMRPLINPNHYIESKTMDRNDRLYLVRGVDTRFPFSPQTLFEIKQISWFNIDEVPEHKKDLGGGRVASHGQPSSAFFTIYPYMRRLKVWIGDKLEGRNQINCFRVKGSGYKGDEEENSAVEIYLREAGYTITPTPRHQPLPQPQSASSTSTSISINKAMGEDVLRNALREMTLNSSNNNNKKGQSQEGSGGIKENKDKGKKIKKRLFAEEEDKKDDNVGVAGKINTWESPHLNEPINYPSVQEFSKFRAKSWANFVWDEKRLLEALGGGAS